MTNRSLVQPLPAVLDTPLSFNLLRRRKNIGDYHLASVDLERFNHLLARLGRDKAPLGMDQLATAARQLSAATDEAAPECIAQRIAWIESVVAMAGDPAWEAANDVADCARLVVDYANDVHDLIPDWMPRIGRLDDAIVIDAAWPTLHHEAACYEDFRRLRALEASLRGCSPDALPFDRQAWQVARQAEAALIAHRRRVRESSYVPAPSAMFRVH
ncbi:YkvA family protein [Pseudoxanthomonas daejeonensis]|nr:YkvA family protein [Pseudoxanthomonas daejeonensis]